ncbi:MAG: phytanoyl-CoA dioxygenase family protein [Pseudomonadota bacterium]
MPKFLTQTQIDQFLEEGYISPIDVMSEDEAASYREKLEQVERDYPVEINAENRNNPHLTLKFMDELVHHPVVIDAVEDLIGPNISLWGSVLFIKEPQSKGFVSWHQDATYMGIEPHDFVTPWIALTHSNLNNGCMSMIPGSHKHDIHNHDDTFEDDNILTRGQVVRDADVDSAVDLILRPGQMSIHHARIIHGSQPNLSNDRRIGYAIQGYMPAHSRQVLGKNYWIDVRGDNPRKNSVSMQRPKFDLDPVGVANRKKVNDNWADILYQGADKKRAY